MNTQSKVDSASVETQNEEVVATGGFLTCRHLKDGVQFEYTLELRRLKEAINASDSTLANACHWMNQAVISRGGSRWRDFLGKPDGTDAMLAVLIGSKNEGRFKVTDKDRKNATAAMNQFKMAPEALKAQFLRNNGTDYVDDFDALCQIYMKRRIKLADLNNQV